MHSPAASVLTSTGLTNITEQIFLQLDHADLMSCRAVCRHFKTIVDNHPINLKRKLTEMQWLHSTLTKVELTKSLPPDTSIEGFVCDEHDDYYLLTYRHIIALSLSNRNQVRFVTHDTSWHHSVTTTSASPQLFLTRRHLVSLDTDSREIRIYRRLSLQIKERFSFRNYDLKDATVSSGFFYAVLHRDTGDGKIDVYTTSSNGRLSICRTVEIQWGGKIHIKVYKGRMLLTSTSTEGVSSISLYHLGEQRTVWQFPDSSRSWNKVSPLLLTNSFAVASFQKPSSFGLAIILNASEKVMLKINLGGENGSLVATVDNDDDYDVEVNCESDSNPFDGRHCIKANVHLYRKIDILLRFRHFNFVHSERFFAFQTSSCKETLANLHVFDTAKRRLAMVTLGKLNQCFGCTLHIVNDQFIIVGIKDGTLQVRDLNKRGLPVVRNLRHNTYIGKVIPFNDGVFLNFLWSTSHFWTADYRGIVQMVCFKSPRRSNAYSLGTGMSLLKYFPGSYWGTPQGAGLDLLDKWFHLLAVTLICFLVSFYIQVL